MAESVDRLLFGSDEPSSIISKLALRVVEQVAKSNRLLAELLLAAAIPHRFSVEILEVLQSISEEKTSVRDAIEYFRQLSFVKEIENNLFSYHEEVRNAILQFWREQDHHQKYVSYSNILRIYYTDQGNIGEMLYHWFVVNPDIASVAYRNHLQALLDRRNTIDSEKLLRLAQEQDWSKTPAQIMWMKLAEATLNIQLDKWGDAVNACREVLSGEIDVELKAIALLTLGTGLNYLGQWFEAKTVLEESVGLFTEIKQPIPDTYQSLGWSYFRLGKYDDAYYAFQNALSLAQAIEHLPAQGWALNGLGSLCFSQKQWNKSIEYYQKALKVRQEIDGGDFFSGRSYQNLANVCLQKNELEIALTYAQQALAIQEKTDDQFGMSFSLEILGVVYEKMKDLDKAIEFLEHSLRIRRSLGANKETSDTLLILSRVYKSQGDLDISAEYLLESNSLRANINIH